MRGVQACRRFPLARFSPWSQFSDSLRGPAPPCGAPITVSSNPRRNTSWHFQKSVLGVTCVRALCHRIRHGNCLRIELPSQSRVHILYGALRDPPEIRALPEAPLRIHCGERPSLLKQLSMESGTGSVTALLVEIQDLSKSYRRGAQEIPVLRNLYLDVARGEFLALMGPSGSGKTTLLNLIAGIDRPDSGMLRVGGIDIGGLGEAELSSWRATHVGFIFQFYNLIPVLTALENVQLPLSLTALPRRERKEHALAALEAVGLSDRTDHYPSQLSGGQQQRVAIARALVTDPLILVADEPTGDLDKISATDVLNLLGELNDRFQKTIVMVTHDPRAARKSKRILYLDKGVLAESMRNEF